MPKNRSSLQFRKDCLKSLPPGAELSSELQGHRIAVMGGFGFVGTWMSHIVSTLIDDFGANLRLDLYGRSSSLWCKRWPDLAKRREVSVTELDVRTPFDLPSDTTVVVFAAGINNPSMHASDPIRVFETTVRGVKNTLDAALSLSQLAKFVNISSGLVSAPPLGGAPSRESDLSPLDFTRSYNVYPESRRAAENLVSLYASQFRLPTVTARAFTFLGPGQPLDVPWAANNFIRDALLGMDIRLHSDGSARRSYLYGSDVATWILGIISKGEDGGVYNLGGCSPITHRDFAENVASLVVPKPQLRYGSQIRGGVAYQDFFPDLSRTTHKLNLFQVFDVNEIIVRTLKWHAEELGLTHRLNFSLTD